MPSELSELNDEVIDMCSAANAWHKAYVELNCKMKVWVPKEGSRRHLQLGESDPERADANFGNNRGPQSGRDEIILSKRENIFWRPEQAVS